MVATLVEAAAAASVATAAATAARARVALVARARTAPVLARAKATPQWPGAPAATVAGRQRRGGKVALSSCVGP